MAQYTTFILISLLLSAFFSGIEIAFISSNKLHIELKGKNGNITSRILSRFLKKPSQFIGTTLIGNTLALVIYGILMAKILEPIFMDILPSPFNNHLTIFIIQTIVSTIIVLIIAEFIPKSIFLINPNRLLSISSIPMSLVYYALYPLVLIIVNLSKLIIKKSGLQYSESKPAFGLTDLNDFIKRIASSSDNKTDAAVDSIMFHNALELKKVKVRECMVPRIEFSTIEVNDSVDDLKQVFIKSGHSKIIVYKDSIDDVIGYVHSSELFKKPGNVKDILTPLIIVPETMLANELMIQFTKEHRSIALIVDEYGGTSGLVSMEDIIEEIFGEIQDEHDEDELVEEQMGPSSFLLSARHEIDYLNNKYGWDLPTGDYETLGGFLLQLKGDLPEKEEEIKYASIIFKVISVADIKIDTIRVDITSTFEDTTD